LTQLQAGGTGKCPHCGTGVRFETVQLNGTSGSQRASINTVSGQNLTLLIFGCPVCGRPVVVAQFERQTATANLVSQNLLWPDSAVRPIPKEVESEALDLAEDFRESLAVYPKSKKASAALSRRCLQYILAHKGGAKRRDLADQIEEVLPSLPAQLALNVDAIRQVGNFAAHPMKSTSSGEIAQVEDGEAEWLIEVLKELFEHYYVAPARATARRTALNSKLAELGKPPLKAA
jgi:hypothetical protein